MPEKFYITSDNKVIIKCPACGKAKPVSADKFSKHGRQVKGNIKCPCGESFSFIIERRKYFRKETNIPGRYKLLSSSVQTGYENMIVKDISKTGLRITPVGAGAIKLGDKLEIEFKLDDKQRTEINVEAEVVNLLKGDIGVQFSNPDPYDHNMKAIGFYLF